MKRMTYYINFIFLILNIFLFLYFSGYTILGSRLLKNYITADDIEFQLISAVIFEFIFFAISKIMSLINKVDLSYKGVNVLKLIPKKVIITAILIAATIIIYSIIAKINYEFVIMILVMTFSILVEFGITICFKKAVLK